MHFIGPHGVHQPSSAFFGLPRAFHAATLRRAAKRRPDHMQQSTDWHMEALQHGLRPKGRDRIASSKAITN